MNISDLPLIEAAGAAATLVAEHISLYSRPRRLSRPAAYAVGTATLGAWFTAWALRTGNHEAAVAFWSIASAGGAAVAACYLARDAAADARLIDLERSRHGTRASQGSGR